MRPALAIPLLAVGLRLAFFAAVWIAGDPGISPTSDSVQYVAAARSLLEGRGYVGVDGPEILRPPGYPIFLLPGLWLGAPVVVTVLLQALLGGLTCALVHDAVRRATCDARASRIAALLVAVDGVLVAWSARLMTETLLATATAMIAWLLVRYAHDPQRWRLALAAVTLAAAAYVKPIALLLPPVLALAVAFRPARPRRAAARAADAALVVGVAVMVCAPWVVRNGLARGYWGFSSQLDRVLSFSAPAAAVAATEGRAFTDVRNELRREHQRPGYEDQGYGELRRRGLSALRANAGAYARVHLAGMVRVLLAPGALPLHEPFVETATASRAMLDGGMSGGLAHRLEHPGLLATDAVLLGPLLLLLGAAARGTFRGRAPAGLRVALAALVAGFLLLSGGPWAQSRFRAPMVPLLATLAGLGLAPRGREARA